jgi:hypothetical protein
MGATCPVCLGAFEQLGRGRPRVYCSARCRRQVERLRVAVPHWKRQLAWGRPLATARSSRWAYLPWWSELAEATSAAEALLRRIDAASG